MKRKHLPYAFLIMLALFVHFLHGQQTQLKLMEGRNGKPIRNECVNVWTGTGPCCFRRATTSPARLTISPIVLVAGRPPLGWSRSRIRFSAGVCVRCRGATGLRRWGGCAVPRSCGPGAAPAPAARSKPPFGWDDAAAPGSVPSTLPPHSAGNATARHTPSRG